MRLFLNDNHYIASIDARLLISLSMERVLHIVGCALIDQYVEHFLLLLDFPTLAGLALAGIVEDLALATTDFAGIL